MKPPLFPRSCWAVLLSLAASLQITAGYYDPGIQRWINRDPIGEQNSPTLFLFGNNNAVVMIDPDGRAAQKVPDAPPPKAPPPKKNPPKKTPPGGIPEHTKDCDVCKDFCSRLNGVKGAHERKNDENWIANCDQLCHHIFGNDAAALKGFKGATAAQVTVARALVEADLQSSVLVRAGGEWRDILAEAVKLAEQHGAALDCRSLDILHCAAAKVLGTAEFVSTGGRQKKLAVAMGLNRVAI